MGPGRRSRTPEHSFANEKSGEATPRVDPQWSVDNRDPGADPGLAVDPRYGPATLAEIRHSQDRIRRILARSLPLGADTLRGQLTFPCRFHRTSPALTKQSAAPVLSPLSVADACRRDDVA